jgi:hypothetical protein
MYIVFFISQEFWRQFQIHICISVSQTFSFVFEEESLPTQMLTVALFTKLIGSK